ncbi:MAG: hypothetical protein AAB774_02570 [Patescibacteria group bacterium]
MTSTTRESARSLRADGFTYNEINSRLGSTLSKSTLSTWCRDIKLPEEHRKRIKKLNLEKLAVNRKKALAVNRETRRRYLLGLESQYIYFKEHLNNDPSSSLAVLAVLYLTEGSKQSGKLTFGNSDPRIIKLYLKLLRKCFSIDETKFRSTVQCRADQDQLVLEEFWSSTTKIPKRNFYKTRIDSRSIGKSTQKESYMGVCRLDYFSGGIYNELQAIIHLITL